MDDNIAHEIGMLQGHISLPSILTNQTFGSLVGRSSPEVTIVVEEELVNAGLMRKQRIRDIAAIKDAELADFPITTRTEYNGLSTLRFRVDGKVLDASSVALEGLNALTSRDFENQNLCISTTGNKQVLSTESRTGN
jgi:hypothetical protein